MLFHCATHLLVSWYHHVVEVHLLSVVSYQFSVHFLLWLGQPTVNGLCLCVTQHPEGVSVGSLSSCTMNTSSGGGCSSSSDVVVSVSVSSVGLDICVGDVLVSIVP